MISVILSRLVVLVLGTLYPAFASYKAVKTKNVKEYVRWMMYWIVFALFTFVETLSDLFISWFPFYYEIKIIFVLWLLSPATNGSSILYRKFVHPQLSKREKDIDNVLAKASEHGYSAVMTLGTKGINYAASAIASTAAKGQAKLADHVRSYSVGDLSNDNVGDRTDGGHGGRFDPVDEDDEIDNRLIEEQYNREMAEMSANQRPPPYSAAPRDMMDVGDGVEDIHVSTHGRRRAAQTRKSSHNDNVHYATLPRSSGRQRSTRTAVYRVD